MCATTGLWVKSFISDPPQDFMQAAIQPDKLVFLLFGAGKKLDFHLPQSNKWC